MVYIITDENSLICGIYEHSQLYQLVEDLTKLGFKQIQSKKENQLYFQDKDNLIYVVSSFQLNTNSFTS